MMFRSRDIDDLGFKMAAILKIQDGGQKVLEKNGNIEFRNLWTQTFPKIHSFHNLQNAPTGLHSKLD